MKNEKLNILLMFVVLSFCFVSLDLIAGSSLCSEYYGPYQCMKTNENIKVDGELDEETWGKAKPIKFKGLANGEEPKYDSTAKKTNEKICRIGWTWLVKDEKMEKLISTAKKLGFNILISPTGTESNYKYINKLCDVASDEDIEIYYRFTTILARKESKKFCQKYCQIISEKEVEEFKTWDKANIQWGGEPLNPKDIYSEDVLCFHHPEVVKHCKNKLKDALIHCPNISGIAFDFIGYKNYKYCKCPVSERLFDDYYNKLKKTGNTISRKRALEQFSLNTLVDFSNELADYIRKLKPEIKIATHIYPTFLANPVYGNRLDIDYCCQTAAWFFEPFWDLKKVSEYTVKITKNEKQFFRRCTGIPFVGIYMDRPGQNKPAERFQEELKTIRRTGCKNISISPFNIFLKHPKLGNILIEELNK